MLREDILEEVHDAPTGGGITGDVEEKAAWETEQVKQLWFNSERQENKKEEKSEQILIVAGQVEQKEEGRRKRGEGEGGREKRQGKA
jgi:hypothetical protein